MEDFLKNNLEQITTGLLHIYVEQLVSEIKKKICMNFWKIHRKIPRRTREILEGTSERKKQLEQTGCDGVLGSHFRQTHQTCVISSERK